MRMHPTHTTHFASTYLHDVQTNKHTPKNTKTALIKRHTHNRTTIIIHATHKYLTCSKPTQTSCLTQNDNTMKSQTQDTPHTQKQRTHIDARHATWKPKQHKHPPAHNTKSLTQSKRTRNNTDTPLAQENTSHKFTSKPQKQQTNEFNAKDFFSGIQTAGTKWLIYWHHN